MQSWFKARDNEKWLQSDPDIHKDRHTKHIEHPNHDNDKETKHTLPKKVANFRK